MRLVCGNISQIQKQQISLTGTDVEKARVEVEKRRVGPNLPPSDLLCRGAEDQFTQLADFAKRQKGANANCGMWTCDHFQNIHCPL